MWISVAIFLWPYHGALLTWDEVDYVNAAQLGVWANAIEKGSLTPLQFARLAKAKTSGQTYLSQGYDESKDPFLLRHFHPPLVIYLESLILRPYGHPGERVVRSSQLCGALALIGALFLAYRSLGRQVQWPGMIVIALLAFWMCQSLFSSLQFHGWAAVWAVALSTVLFRWLDRFEASLAIAVSVSLALGALTLETAAILLVGIFVCLILWRPRRMAVSRSSWWSGALVLTLTVLLVSLAWPGALLKLSPIKTLAMYLYRIRLGQEYAHINYRSFLATLAPMLVLIPPAGAWLLFCDREHSRRWGPYVIIGAIYGLTMTKFAIGAYYLVAALAPFTVVIAFAADRLRSTWARTSIAAAVTILVGLSTFSAYRSRPQQDPLGQDLPWLRESLRGREILADGAHIFRYYLGDDYVIQTIVPSYDGKLLERTEGKYSPLSPREVSGKIVLVLNRGSNELKPSELDLLGHCSRRDGAFVRMYDCGEVVP